MDIQESGYKIKYIIFLLRLKQENQEQLLLLLMQLFSVKEETN